MKREDLSGQTFGYWTVISNDPANGSKALCRCECGRIKSVFKSNLKNGSSQSCGCKIPRGKIDLVGTVLGRLTVITDDPDDKRSVICKCECGNIVSMPRVSITSRMAKSCGCYRRECGRNLGNETQKYNRIFGTNFQTIERSRPNRNNATGIKGVHWNRREGRYKVEIGFQGQRYYLGGYAKIEDAVKARRRAEEELFDPIIEEKNEYLREIGNDQSN